eukprot:7054365-Alexandrium_andersonii.AAC.1
MSCFALAALLLAAYIMLRVVARRGQAGSISELLREEGTQGRQYGVRKWSEWLLVTPPPLDLHSILGIYWRLP